MTLSDWQKKLIEGLFLILSIVAVVGYLDHRHSVQETAILAVAKEQNLQSQNTIQQLQADKTQLQTQFSTLQTQITTVQAQTVQQLAAIKNLSPTQLATQAQTGLGTGKVTVSPTNSGEFELDSPAVQAALQQSIQLKADQLQITYLGGEVSNLQQTVADDTKQLAAKDAIIKNDEQVVIPQLKAENGRSKRKWFAIGVVVGFLGRVLTHA